MYFIIPFFVPQETLKTVSKFCFPFSMDRYTHIHICTYIGLIKSKRIELKSLLWVFNEVFGAGTLLFMLMTLLNAIVFWLVWAISKIIYSI